MFQIHLRIVNYLVNWVQFCSITLFDSGVGVVDTSAVGPWVDVVHPRVGSGKGVDGGPFKHANETIIFRLMGWDVAYSLCDSNNEYT